MEKPIINLIEDQKIEEINPNIDNWEVEQLLRKYGYEPASNYLKPKQPELTFEDMIKQEEDKKLINKKTIQNKDGYNNSEIKYSTDDDTGFTFKVEINTDMNLPRY